SVALESPGGLAEVAVERLDVVPAGASTLRDDGVPDGRHVYAVAAVDRYGAEGEPGTVETGIGDVDPPAPPTGLGATPVGRDVHLAWNASPEADVTGYVVQRDGLRVGTAAAPSFVDAARPNGTYSYTVIAVDAAGHESLESEPASATVAVAPEPPSAPVILDPTDSAHPITIDVSRTDVAGRADAGSIVTLEVDGQARGTATAGPGFRRAGEVTLGSGYVALSPDGRWAAWSGDATSVSVQDLDTGAVRRWLHGGSTGAEELAFSPDGTALALSRPHPEPPYLRDVAVLRLDDGSVRVLTQASPWEYAWSPDGARLAVAQYDGSLGLVDAATGTLTVRETGSGLPTYLRWSPDGTNLAFVRSWSGSAAELRILGEGASPARVLDRDAWPYTPPSWSPDGRRLAWTAAGTPLRVRVQDLGEAAPAAEIGEAGSDVLDARFSPDGSWLDFVRLTTLLDGTRLRSVHAIDQRQGQRVTVAEPQPVFAELDAHDWLGGRLALRTYDQLELFAPEPGLFVVRDVPLAPNENRLVARASEPTSSLSSAASETVLVTVADEAFPDLVVPPAGIVSLPPVPLATRPAFLRLRVENGGETDAGGVEVLVRVTGPGGSLVVDTRATLAVVPAGEHASLLLPWTPAVAGSYSVQVEVDPDARVEELSEVNNAAGRSVTVVAAEGIAAAIDSDRSSYPALATAHVTVQAANAGAPFTGLARTTVEDASSGQVALLDERPVSLEWGKSVSFGLDWPVGTTLAGPLRPSSDGENDWSRNTLRRPGTRCSFAGRPGPSSRAPMRCCLTV
ncbi:MAG TPA: CARDB domain-containing protein, partial [Vicinamibacteria bacterium]